MAAFARMLDAVADGAARARAAVNQWLAEHEDGIALFVVVASLLADVMPKAGDLADEWMSGPWAHLLESVELGDALALLVGLAESNDAIEQLLEAVLARADVVQQLTADVEEAPIPEPLRHQLRHGLELFGTRDYLLAVPALIQGMEGSFWAIAEDSKLIVRDGDRMREGGTLSAAGRTIGGVESVIGLLNLDPTYSTFLRKLVFGGRGKRFRHGTAVDGWRLEALLLVIALTTWLETFGASRGEPYLQRTFTSSEAPLTAAQAAFPALKMLAELKPEAVKPTMEALMVFSQVRPQLGQAVALDSSDQSFERD
jgi:hypothetical protein